jgi:hypothetical protein
MPVCIFYWPCCMHTLPEFLLAMSPPQHHSRLPSALGTLLKRRTLLRNVQRNAEPLCARSAEKPSKNANIVRVQRPYRSCPAATQPLRQRRTHCGIVARIRVGADDASAFPAQLHGEIEHHACNIGHHATVQAHNECRRILPCALQFRPTLS